MKDQRPSSFRSEGVEEAGFHGGSDPGSLGIELEFG